MDVVKISRINTGFLDNNKIDNSFYVVNKNKPSTSEISELSRKLYQSNIDLSNTTFGFNANSIDFNVQFLNQTEQKVTLNGYFSKNLTSGSFSFAYNYLRAEVLDGKPIEKQFEVNFNLTFNSVKSVSIETKEVKEDILDFLRRITKEVFSKLNESNVNIKAIVLDPEDLKDISQLADCKTAKLIYQLIEMIKYTVEAKMMWKKNENAQDIIYRPVRFKQDIKEAAETNELNIDYSFSIREISKNSAAG